MSAGLRWLLGIALPPLVALATLLGGGLASADAVDPLVLENPRVAGGEETWHADDDFLITWDAPPPPAPELPIAATLYRIRDADGNVVVGERRVRRRLPPLNHVHVPPVPGRYTADLWLEGTDGRRGPQASVSLRFDDARPSEPSRCPSPASVATPSPSTRTQTASPARHLIGAPRPRPICTGESAETRSRWAFCRRGPATYTRLPSRVRESARRASGPPRCGSTQRSRGSRSPAFHRAGRPARSG